MDTRPYDDRPIPQTHVKRLERLCRRWGLRPAAHHSATVLEVGCAHGVNLMAMAARLPDATFVGIDIDPEAVAIAEQRAHAAGLHNVRFDVADVQDLEFPPGTFDYAIAHGVLSWVSEPVGKALFELFERALSTEGVAYVSFDAMPGAALRETIGLGLRGFETGDVEQIRGALAVLHAGAKPNTLQGAWLHTEVSAALGQSASFLEQQFLSPHQRALSLSEVWDEGEAHGFRFVDDVAETGLPDAALAETTRAISAIAPNRRAAEQLLDAAIHRQFRASVFTRSSRPIADSGAGPQAESVKSVISAKPWVLPLTRVEARSLGFVSTPDLGHRALHPLHSLLVEALDGSRTHAELEQLVVESVATGRLALPTESGEPATLQEAERGASAVVASALHDLADAGILRPTTPS